MMKQVRSALVRAECLSTDELDLELEIAPGQPRLLDGYRSVAYYYR